MGHKYWGGKYQNQRGDTTMNVSERQEDSQNKYDRE